MASIGENLRSFITSSTGVLAVFSGAAAPNAVLQNKLPYGPPLPRIWFGRASQEEEVDLSGTGGLVESSWNIEAISDDVDEALEIADAVKADLNGHRGTFGSGTVKGCFVEDHDDDYQPKGVGSEDGFYVAAISARIFFSTT